MFFSLLEDKCVQTGSYLNTEVSVESFTKDITKFLEAGLNYDAEIRCGYHSVKAHKIVLGARSDVFKAMLESDMLEGRTGLVEIEDMDASYIQDFVTYLHTGSMPEMNYEKAVCLYEAGDKSNVRSLVLRCSEYLQDSVCPEIACQCLALADAHSDLELKNKITNYILDEKIYLQDKLWLPFCENYPRLANELYRIAVPNKNLFLSSSAILFVSCVTLIVHILISDYHAS